MDRVHITRDDQPRLIREIDQEARKLYQDRYGRRNPTTLSMLELDAIKIEAGKRVQDRMKGRLIP